MIIIAICDTFEFGNLSKTLVSKNACLLASVITIEAQLIILRNFIIILTKNALNHN